MEIYIDDKERLDASVAANSFADKNTRNRAYINTLGAQLVMKYLASENINTNSNCNIHSIKKILEEIDLSDIMLDNMHIDVRVVFDENAIFIPKSHFEYNIVPDVYLVLQLADDSSHVKFLGFFEPKLINKSNANNDYYFIEKEKLTSPLNLKEFITNFEGKASEKLSDDEMEKSEQIIVSLNDNDVNQNDKKYLIQQLVKSAELRDKFIEYENFETLCYKAMADSNIDKSLLYSLNNTVQTFEEETFQEPITEEESEELIENNAVEDNNLLENNETLDNLVMEGFENDLTNLDITDDLPVFEPLGEELPIENEINNEDIVAVSLNQENETFDETTENIESLDNMMENISLDGFENIETVDLLEETNTETISLDGIEEVEQIENTAEIENFTETISLENVEQAAINEQESFGKNLLENLALENMDNIQIEGIDNFASDLPAFEENIDFSNIGESKEEPEKLATPIEAQIIDEQLFEDQIIEDQMINEQVIAEQPAEDLPFISEPSNINEGLPFEENEPTSELPFEDAMPFDTSNEILNEEISNELSEELPQIDDLPFNATDDFNSDINEEVSQDYTPTDEILQDEIINESEFSEEIPNFDELQPEEIFNNTLSDTEDNIVEDASDTSIDDLLDSSDEEETEELEVLFNDTDTDNDTLEDIQEEPAVPGAALFNTPQKTQNNKKSVLVAAALLTVVAGACAFYFLKPKDEFTTAEVTPTPLSTPKRNTLETNTPNIEKSIEVTKKPEANKPKELNNTQAKPVNTPHTYMNVNKLVWDVPDTLSYNPKIQNYLRVAGKSIKLSLSTDLLLATEYAYTNQVKIGLKLSSNGNIQDAKILSSSGSTQIDNIVLQSVKDTLNVVKTPSGEVNTPDFNLNLIIYF